MIAFCPPIVWRRSELSRRVRVCHTCVGVIAQAASIHESERYAAKSGRAARDTPAVYHGHPRRGANAAPHHVLLVRVLR